MPSFWTGSELIDLLNEDESAESMLEDLEGRVVAAFADASGRHFGKVTPLLSLERTLRDQRSLFVANPIVALTKVRMGATPGESFTGLSEYALTDFGFGPDAGLADNEVMRLSGPYPPGVFVEITYTAGFNTPSDVPGGLKQDVFDIVANKWRARVTADGPADEQGERTIVIPDRVIRRHTMAVGL